MSRSTSCPSRWSCRSRCSDSRRRRDGVAPVDHVDEFGARAAAAVEAVADRLVAHPPRAVARWRSSCARSAARWTAGAEVALAFAGDVGPLPLEQLERMLSEVAILTGRIDLVVGAHTAGARGEEPHITREARRASKSMFMTATPLRCRSSCQKQRAGEPLQNQTMRFHEHNAPIAVLGSLARCGGRAMRGSPPPASAPPTPPAAARTQVRVPSFPPTTRFLYFVMTDRFCPSREPSQATGGARGHAQGRRRHVSRRRPARPDLETNAGWFDKLGVNALWITAPYEQIHGWVWVATRSSSTTPTTATTPYTFSITSTAHRTTCARWSTPRACAASTSARRSSGVPML